MGFMGIGSKGKKITAHTMVGLTEAGKETADTNTSGGRTFAILARLRERQPQSLSSLNEDLGMDMDELKARVEILVKQNVVTVTSLEE
jgi:hypothetical protein